MGEYSSKLNSHNEWDPLREIIVGSNKGSVANLSWLNKREIPEESLKEAKNLAKKACPKKITEEIEEDLDNLALTLERENIIVHRPKVFDQSKFFSTSSWYVWLRFPFHSKPSSSFVIAR